MKVVEFAKSYSRMIVEVMFGMRDTRYPIGPIWRWRHVRYKDL